MDRKTKVILGLIIVVMITCVFSYGYFMLDINMSATPKNLAIDTFKKSLVYTEILENGETPGEFLNFRLEPGESKERVFTVTNTSKVDIVYYDLFWEVLKNTFTLNDYFKYEITCSSLYQGTTSNCIKKRFDNEVGRDIEENANLAAINVPNTGAFINIIENIKIRPGEQQTFTMTINYENANAIQDVDKDAVFNGQLNIKEHINGHTYTIAIANDNGSVNNTGNGTDTVSILPTETRKEIDIAPANGTYYIGYSYDSTKVTATYDRDTNKLVLTDFVDNDTINITYYTEEEIYALYDNCTSTEHLECYLRSNYSTLGLTKVFHEPTDDFPYPTVSYRYQGATPSNYLYFNEEQYRILGVYQELNNSVNPTFDDLVFKVKIIYEDASPLSSEWNGDGSYINSDIQTTLNDYYASLGAEIKSMISPTYYYFGNISIYSASSDVFAYERSGAIFENYRIQANIGMMNPSDVIYSFDDTISSCKTTAILADGYFGCQSWLWDMASVNNIEGDEYILGMIDGDEADGVVDRGPALLSMILADETVVISYGDLGEPTWLRPVFYLNPDYEYIEGNGESETAFNLPTE